MSKFPKKLMLPQEVIKSREERLQQLLSSCVFGILVRLAIIAAELFGVYLFGSAALLMDAISSTIDIISSVLLVICIRFAARPPDKNHPFGHGRFEPLVGLQLGIFTGLVGISMLVHQATSINTFISSEIMDAKAWIIPFFAMILLEICYQVVIGVAKKQNSPALAADAIHYRIDGLTSLFATIALGVAAFFPAYSHLCDHVGALSISLLMIGLGVYATFENFNQLMDKVPDGQFFKIVKDASFKVSGVLGVEKIRIQNYGPDAHVDIDVEVEPKLSVDAAHKISQKVRLEIQKAWPAVRDVTVHIEPFYPGDH